MQDVVKSAFSTLIVDEEGDANCTGSTNKRDTVVP